MQAKPKLNLIRASETDTQSKKTKTHNNLIIAHSMYELHHKAVHKCISARNVRLLNVVISAFNLKPLPIFSDTEEQCTEPQRYKRY